MVRPKTFSEKDESYLSSSRSQNVNILRTAGGRIMENHVIGELGARKQPPVSTVRDRLTRFQSKIKNSRFRSLRVCEGGLTV